MGNVHMEATQINYREGNKKMSVAQAIKNAGSEITPEEKAWIDTIPELASQEIIAPEFDAEEGVYSVGDLVIYQGGLYKFTTAHETAGAWNPEEVAAVKVSEELSSLESGLTNTESSISTLASAIGGLKCYKKNTEGSASTVIFTNTENRYTGLLMITDNNGYNAIFAVGFKYGDTEPGTFLTRIGGSNALSVSLDSDGSITVPMSAWSTAELITTNPNIT